MVASWLLTGSPATAASLMQYQLSEADRQSEQTLIFQDKAMLLKSAGGDPNLDILYEPNTEQLTLIDHQKKQFTPVTQERIDQLSAKTETVKPLLQGFAAQWANLSPKQKAKWSAMLGGIPVEQYLAAINTAASTTVNKAGKARKLAGLSCQPMQLKQKKSTLAEFCVTEPSALGLDSEDTATLESLLAFIRKNALKLGELMAPMGIGLSGNLLADMRQIPIQFREIPGKSPVSLSLNHVVKNRNTDQKITVPEGYAYKKLRLW